MRTLSLIETATEHDATLWEDEDPNFDPDYAWLDQMEADALADAYAGWVGI